MYQSSIGFALVGCGRVAQRYLGLLREIPQARIVAVCDVKLDRASEAGRIARVPFYRDMHDMMTRHIGAIDVICVLTESGMHAAHTRMLSPYGKHLVVEKPMALTLSDADGMICACDLAGIKLFIVMQNRFNLPVTRLKKAIDCGRFGKLVLGTARLRWCRTQSYFDQDRWRGTSALDGGVLMNQASHYIDLLGWMLGPVQRVHGIADRMLVDIETDDTAIGVVRFCSGSLGVIEATIATRPSDLEGSISILGEEGTVEVGGIAANILKVWKFTTRWPEDDEKLECFSENPPDVYGYGHRRFLSHVVEAILYDRPPLIDGLEGRKSLEFIDAFYRSATTS